MRRILPLLALSTAITLLVVGLGTALTTETPPLPTGSGSVGTNGPQADGTTPSKWTETDGFGGSAPKKGKKS
jgi:hypothetical protein